MEVDAQGYGREPTAMVRGVLSCLFVCLFLTRRQRRPFFFTRNGVFWDACWSWLGARPRTALWQTGGNGTHAVRSAVGRAVGRTAGQDCGTGGRPTGYSLYKGSIPLGGSPRLLSATRALLPKRVFYLEGGGRKPGQWERARARVRQTWGFFMDVYSGGRTGEGCGPFREKQACRFSVNICLFVCFFVCFRFKMSRSEYQHEGV